MKARAYDENHKLWHAAPGFGGRVETEFAGPESAEVIRYHDLGDSAFWTGQYVASQSFRYAVTREEEARENARRGVTALDAYLKATGKEGFIGRFAGPVSSKPLFDDVTPCDSENCHILTDGAYSGNFWIGNTSRDQYTGWFYGMSLFYDLVGDEDLKEVIREDVKAVIDRLIADDWTIVDVDGIPTTAGPRPVVVMQLMYLITAREVIGTDEYRETYSRRASELAPVEKIGALTWPNTYFQYFGISLSYLASFNLWRLEDDEERQALHVETIDEMMYPPVANTHQVFFDYIWMIETGKRPEVLVQDTYKSLLDFPGSPKRKIHPYHPKMPADPLSLIANDLFEALGLGEIVPDINPRSIDPYPMSQRCVTGDYWQGSPWALECGSDNPDFEFAGEDYLQAYWMGRYYGFLKETD